QRRRRQQLENKIGRRLAGRACSPFGVFVSTIMHGTAKQKQYRHHHPEL
ncbi:hypothetical protein PoMZ_11552, partial [Pyricularia oryzae]